jgi:hypothetical protein
MRYFHDDERPEFIDEWEWVRVEIYSPKEIVLADKDGDAISVTYDELKKAVWIASRYFEKCNSETTNTK